MPLIALDQVPVKEIFPGFRARLVHTDRVTHSWVEIDPGAAFPEHRHPHEQVVSVLEGTLELTVDATTYRLTRGTVFVIPPDVPHSGRALSPCIVLDTFSPARDDYR